MRILLILALVSCAVEQPPSVEQPIGASCSSEEATLCDNYRGLCVDDVCRKQCTGWPYCAADERDVLTVVDGRRACYCVPR